LTDSQIAAALREGYGLSTDRVTFLPVGNDSGAWSYRIDALSDVVDEAHASEWA
jgi:hypothetical protein